MVWVQTKFDRYTFLLPEKAARGAIPYAFVKCRIEILFVSSTYIFVSCILYIV